MVSGKSGSWPRVAAIVVAVAFISTALAQEFRWTMVTGWPAAHGYQLMVKEFADSVERASGGRMVIDVHPAGAIVGAFEVLDAVDAGVAEMGHGWLGWWMGKHPATNFFASLPAHLEAPMYMAWFYDGGGIELLNRLLQDEMGLNVLARPAGVYSAETFAWSNRPIRTIEDLVGLRFRTVGWWADILREAGVAVVSIPGGEVFPALERGVIDAGEFTTPWGDRLLAFYEVTRYFTGPGIHQPTTAQVVLINRTAWERLPPDLQAIIEMAAEANTIRSWSRDMVMSMKAVDYYVEQGMTVVKIDEEAQHALRERAWAFIDRVVAEDAFSAEVWASMQEFYARFVEFDRLMLPVRPPPQVRE